MENLKSYNNYIKEQSLMEEAGYHDIVDFINNKLNNLSDKQMNLLKRFSNPFMGKSKNEIEGELNSKIINIDDPYNEEEWDEEKIRKMKYLKVRKEI